MELKSSGWLYTVLLTLALKTQVAHTTLGTIKGMRQVCQQEGKPYEVNHIDRKKCYDCRCIKGYVQCRDSCPQKEGCYLLVAKPFDGCCDICKGCVYNGRLHPSYTEWTDPNEPCKVFRCEASFITVSQMQCHADCPNPLPPGPGQCCPTCPDCRMDGHVLSENRDPCLKCTCSGNKKTCVKKACPVLNCPKKSVEHKMGDCCPKCVGTGTFYSPPNNCLTMTKLMKEGESFTFDKCTTCKCHRNETSVCHRKSCPILDCTPKYQRMSDDGCCKECVVQAYSLAVTCGYDGKNFEDGEAWKVDSCTECKCNEGTMRCTRESCKDCPLGSYLVHQPGQCCGKCIEKNGVCTVYGDPHYITFDRHMYNFKGMGKFQLTADCHHHSFSIRVANAPQIKNKSSTITKRVSIKLGDVRINLGQRLRTRVNGVKITFPYFKNGIRMKKIGDNLEVTLPNDVNVLWNGKSFLEVTVPPVLKRRLCGLCGNFNSNPQDDLKMRKGPVVDVSKINKFGTSWCVGRKCTAKPHRPCVRRNRERKFCEYFKRTDIFGDCKLSDKYYRDCRMDMCDCPTGKCYCESLMAYAQECKRLGVEVNDWENASFCSGNGLERRPKANNTREMEKLHHLMRHVNFTKTQEPRKGGPPLLPIH